VSIWFTVCFIFEYFYLDFRVFVFIERLAGQLGNSVVTHSQQISMSSFQHILEICFIDCFDYDDNIFVSVTLKL
jgi:hypothetical protein